MNLNKTRLAVSIIGTLLLVYGLGSRYQLSDAFVARGWLALAMGIIGALILWTVGTGHLFLDGFSQLMVTLALCGLLLLGFGARLDLATYDPIKDVWRWVMISICYIIAIACSYGVIAPRELKPYID